MLHKVHIDETIVVSSTVDKLFLTWKDTKRILKRKREEMSLEDFADHLLIEEELRI